MEFGNYYSPLVRRSIFLKKIVDRRFKLIFRWSFVTAGLTTAFWAIWYLVAGEVPTGDVKIFSFIFSRWWDVLIGPIWSTIIIITMTSERFKNDEDHPIFSFFVVCSIFGLTSGFFASLIGGLFFGLIVSVVISIMVAVVIGIFFSYVLLKNRIPKFGIWAKIFNWLMAR